jgi:hypothetical protein
VLRIGRQGRSSEVGAPPLRLSLSLRSPAAGNVCRDARVLFPGSGLPRPGVPALLPRYRFTLPGSPGGFFRIRFTSPGGPGSSSPDPVYLVRGSRQFFPGTGLPWPGVPAGIPRIRFGPPGHRVRPGPDPRKSDLARRTTWPGSGMEAMAAGRDSGFAPRPAACILRACPASPSNTSISTRRSGPG